jgi:hypothetical protein
LQVLTKSLRKTPGIYDIMMNAFFTRSKTRVYHLASGQNLEVQPKTLTAFILLISDFVFSIGTMKTMDLLLTRFFSRHPLHLEVFDPDDNEALPGLDITYTPLHDHPNPSWLDNDRAFIQQAFLYPQFTLVEALMDLLERGLSKYFYTKKLYQDRLAFFMVSAQWLNIVNILGHRALPTPYLRRCFPNFLGCLTSYDLNEGRLSNLPSIASALSEFLFGKNSLFKLAAEDAAKWPVHCRRTSSEVLVDQNWVMDSWIHLRLRNPDVSESHPLYSVASRRFTITNFVELLFFGKMWDVGTSPVDYGETPFYVDTEEKWAHPDFTVPKYQFVPFSVDELDPSKPADADAGGDGGISFSNDFGADDESDEEEDDEDVVQEEKTSGKRKRGSSNSHAADPSEPA